MGVETTIELIDVTFTQNDLGDDIESKTYSQVFATIKESNRNEDYMAMNSGHTVSIVFKMRDIDYGGQEKLRYNSEEYNIIRSPLRGSRLESRELVCEKVR